MKYLTKIFLGTLVIMSLNTMAQSDKETIKRIIEAKTYTFVATSAQPMNSQDISQIMRKIPGAFQGSNISLNNSSYDVIVTPDSVIAYLPYYGRSYSAPVNQNEGGIKFNSKKFDYKAAIARKNNWNITINPKDSNEGYRLMLFVSENGNATLSINSSQKQSISYAGYLIETKVKE